MDSAETGAEGHEAKFTSTQRSLGSVPSESESETKAIPLLYLLFMPNHSSLPTKHRQRGGGGRREREREEREKGGVIKIG